jgi:hypothetical protein
MMAQNSHHPTNRNDNIGIFSENEFLFLRGSTSQ